MRLGRFSSLILIILTFASCGGSDRGRSGAYSDSAAAAPEADITYEAMQWADSITSAMSVEEQAAQLMMPAIFARTTPEYLEKVRWYGEDLRVGSILLLKGEAVASSEIADSLEAIRDRSRLKTGTFLAIDAETGLGMRFSDAPVFPRNDRISHGAGDSIFYDYGREVGREALLAGINMILGPVVDVDRNDNPNGVMKGRSLGSDQLRVAELSLAYSLGLESYGVVSVAKHFPGHGPTATDSHNSLPYISLDEDELYTVDLLPFRKYISYGLTGIMVGHIWAQALDSVRRPASFSPVVITDLLRDEMGFDGLVLVDAVGMGGADGYSGADAVAAGADIIIAPPDTPSEIRNIVEAVQSGRISRDELAEHCRKVLFYKYLFGIPFSSREEIRVHPDKLKERLRMKALPVINSLSSGK